tara:strand:- start:41 stop:280 length:240 start_codon:yes stop_codon:yes gene_type:complete
MRKCLQTCKNLNVSCPIKECKYWIEYKEERNCMFEAISINGRMTLRQVGERLGISYVRVKQIQDKASKKISLLLEEEAI